MITPETITDLPADPGCYLFKDLSGKVLYVGKAKNIRKRVTSYFQRKEHDPKTLLLVKHIHSIDFIVTKNEIEALILENNLIKHHYPRYNIDLKDSRRYAYLCLSKDAFPILSVARTRDELGEYFGPFTSGKMRQEIFNLLTRRFGILERSPSSLRLKSLHPEEYAERVRVAREILKGKVEEVRSAMQKEMERASAQMHYEHALTLRRRLEALDMLQEKQNVELRRDFEGDVIAYAVTEGKMYLLVFNLYRGILENKQQFEFDYYEGCFEEFLLQYYTSAPVPREVIVPERVNPALQNVLREQRGGKVHVYVPERGAQKALLDLAFKNVVITFFGEREKLLDLQSMLSLDRLPRVIECFDISHLGGTHTTASMVQFRDGKPDKDNYRRFKIRTVHDGDDFEAMREVVRRRYIKIVMDDLPMPDLIVIDGGIGQLGAAQSVFKELGLKARVISLAKKLEEIYIPGKKRPLRFSHRQKGLQLLQAVRDEAHRFALRYNRLLRSKAVTE